MSWEDTLKKYKQYNPSPKQKELNKLLNDVGDFLREHYPESASYAFERFINELPELKD